MNKPNIFVTAKHWQIFLIFIVPILMHAILQLSLIPVGLDPEKIDPQEIMQFLPMVVNIAAIFTLLHMSTLFIWFWSIVNTLNKKLSPELVRKTWFFKLCLSFICIFYIAYFYQISQMISAIVESMQFDSFEPDIFSYLLPILLALPIVVFCSIYAMGFVAKLIVMAENDENITISEYIAEFFLIYLYPIGVWFLQPRINKLVSEDDE